MKHIHMIGIKGSGMSALACILHDNGYYVTGSDIEDTLFTEESLRERNITLLPFSPKNIHTQQLVIAGNAFTDDHPEVKEAKEKADTFYRYHDFLGEWLQSKTSIAISGAHGKTSTTGLMSAVFDKMLPTSFLIGDGTGQGKVGTTHFVFEACEYRRHFLAYQPDYAVITNIDYDHPDYFSSLEDVEEAFIHFSSGVKKGLVVCGDDVNTDRLTDLFSCYRYGLKDGNDIQAVDVQIADGITSFELWKDGEFVRRISIPLVGTHHVQNALSVLAISILEGLDLNGVQEALMQYKGVKRRFQTLMKENYIVIDDYAHHPTEIKATLETASLSFPNRKIVAVFQPHTFTRTREFLNEFGQSLSAADQVYLCPIFGSAREEKGELNITHLQNKIPNSKVITEDSVYQLLEEKEAVLLFMGAGDIQKYEHQFMDLVVLK